MSKQTIEDVLKSETEILLFKYLEILQPCTVRSLIEYVSRNYGFEDKFLNFDKVIKKLKTKSKVLIGSSQKCRINPSYKGEVLEINPIYRSKYPLNIIYVSNDVRAFLDSAIVSFEDAINNFNTINDRRSLHKFIISMNNAWQLALFAIATKEAGITAIFENNSKTNKEKQKIAKKISEIDSNRNSTKNIFKLKQNYLTNRRIISSAESNNIDLLNVLRDEIEHHCLKTNSIKQKYWMHWQDNITVFVKVVDLCFPKYLQKENYTLALDIKKPIYKNSTEKIDQNLDNFISERISFYDSNLSCDELKTSSSQKTIIAHIVNVEQRENIEFLLQKCFLEPDKARELLKEIKGRCNLTLKEFHENLIVLVDEDKKNDLLHERECYKYANVFGVSPDAPLNNQELCIYDLENLPPRYKYSKKFSELIANKINNGELLNHTVRDLYKRKAILE